MEIPKYLQVLAAYRWLLAVGAVLAVIAGLFAGFTIRDGEIQSRVERTYPATTTVLLSHSGTPLFESEVTPTEVPDTTVPDPVPLDLANAATIYAYLVASDEIQARVEERIGELADDEALTAVSRTTQPAGDENFPGRLSLPVIDIVGVSTDRARAEEISRVANSVFQQYVVDEQTDRDIPQERRVVLTTLRENPAGEGEGSNPAIPIVVAAFGVFFAFVALAFVLDNIRRNSARRRDERLVLDEPEPEPEAAPSKPRRSTTAGAR